MKKANIEVSLIDSMGNDLSVVNAARVSFSKQSDWDTFRCSDCQNGVQQACTICCPCIEDGAAYGEKRLKKADEKLIQYLAKHKHFSPFNHTFITLKVKAPLFCARQLVKHEYMPWNEESRRYVDYEPEFYFPDVYRKSAENVKQGSSDETVDPDHIWLGGEEAYTEDGSVQYALNYYNWLLMRGVCAEQARMFLPQNMMVNWYWSGTLKAFSKMLNMRLDSHTQRETQEVARQAVELIRPIFPVSLGALLEHS